MMSLAEKLVRATVAAKRKEIRDRETAVDDASSEFIAWFDSEVVPKMMAAANEGRSEFSIAVHVPPGMASLPEHSIPSGLAALIDRAVGPRAVGKGSQIYFPIRPSATGTKDLWTVEFHWHYDAQSQTNQHVPEEFQINGG